MSAAREAKPSGGPKGTSPRECQEADTQCFVAAGHCKEAEA